MKSAGINKTLCTLLKLFDDFSCVFSKFNELKDGSNTKCTSISLERQMEMTFDLILYELKKLQDFSSSSQLSPSVMFAVIDQYCRHASLVDMVMNVHVLKIQYKQPLDTRLLLSMLICKPFIVIKEIDSFII
jgi:hypothetical protein